MSTKNMVDTLFREELQKEYLLGDETQACEIFEENGKAEPASGSFM